MPSTASPVARRLIVEKIPLLAISIAFSVVQIAVDRRALVSLGNTPLSQRLANAVVSYALYLRQAVWPVHLAVFYPHPGASLAAWQVALALAVLAALSAVAFLARKNQPWLIAGWLWYLGMLVPVIGIVQSGDLAHADRYTYLPQIGLYIALTWAAAHWAARRPGRHISHIILGSAGLAILCALLLAACDQASYWRDSETLWTHALECTRDNAVARYNLGVALFRHGRVDDAIAQYREALRLSPAHADVHTNLGDALLQQADTAGAIAEYRQALRIDPAYSLAACNLGVALRRAGRLDDAIAAYRQALRIKPDYADAHNNLAIALTQLGRPLDAIAEYREALRINPAYADAHANLASLLFRQGQPAEARAHLDTALALRRQQLAGAPVP